MSGNTVSQPVQEWLFSFGSGQQHDGRFVVIPGTYDEARDEMFRRFGTAWSLQYPAEERQVMEQQYGMVELTRAEWPPAMVDRAINALSAFGVTTEREAGQLLPMWLHFGAMTADDRTAVYRHYRTELASTAEPANPDRRCRNCGATSGLKMLHRNPLTLADREWECYDGCTGGVS